MNVKYEIQKRLSYMQHMTQDEYNTEIELGPLSVPEPHICPGISCRQRCPRYQIISNVYLPYQDPCETCSHSLVTDGINEH